MSCRLVTIRNGPRGRAAAAEEITRDVSINVAKQHPTAVHGLVLLSSKQASKTEKKGEMYTKYLLNKKPHSYIHT